MAGTPQKKASHQTALILEVVTRLLMVEKQCRPVILIWLQNGRSTEKEVQF